MMEGRLQTMHIFIFSYVSCGTELLTDIWISVLLLYTITIPLYIEWGKE